MSSVKNQLIGYGVALGVGVIAFMYLKKKVGDVAGDVGNAFNPNSRENLAYKGVNAVGATLTGSAPGSWSLGSWLYDITHPGESERIRNAGLTNTSSVGSTRSGYTSDEYSKWRKNQTGSIAE